MEPPILGSDGLQVHRTQYDDSDFKVVEYVDNRYPERKLPTLYDKPAQETQVERDHMVYSGEIAHMTMAEYANFRRRMGLNSGGGGGLYGPPTKTPFDKYMDARNAYIDGKGELDEMIKYVRLEDEDSYDEIFDIDPAYKHRKPRCRWLAWWRLGRRHRGDLGRTRDWEDNVGPALGQRSLSALRSALDSGRI